ncbi:adenylate/guanylate cyclase domain-containing protein [Polaribacter sp. Q13]|uniref:adenylate/guanylate cyclase domain-containing protein n=1 Tax=Polaribacter sp. Q13 TaxID=2806551 RepID=UPI00193C2AB2|nr:adenylate/guanylate cyclase domain-containing protein [Polaribacter sp. Q13]QVY64635.1 tetratricopeptide repeat protein [Polaribacter sp. Q13]
MGNIALNRKRRNKEKYKRIFVLLFFFIVSNSILSQGNKKIENILADSLFNLSSKNILAGNFKKALEHVENSLEIYKNLEKASSIGNCLSKMGTIYYYQGNFTKALSLYDESITYFKKSSYKKGISFSNNNKGAIYYYLGNYPKALDHYKKALKLHEELGNKTQAAGTIKNIGGIYLELEDYKNAMSYFQIAKKTLEKSLDTKTLSQVLNGIGEIYTQQGDYKNAEINFKEGLQLAKKTTDKQTIIEVLIGLGKLYNLQEKYKESLMYYKQSLQISTEINSPIFTSISKVAIGGINYKQGKNKLAIKTCKEGLEIAKKIKVISVQKDAYENLYKITKGIHKNKSALDYYEHMILLEDSLNIKKTTDKILNMKFEKQLLLDSIAHVDKEKKIQIRHLEEVNEKEKQRNVFIGSVFLVLIIAVGLWNRLRYTNKSKAILQIEKDRSEHLLLNILPEEIAQELKEKGYVDAQDFDKATILFTDFKSFTETASKLTPQELVEEINVCFKAFDNIMETYSIEKIKTIGDAYMAAGGLPKPSINSVKKTIIAALEMQAFTVKRKLENDAQGKPAFEMRVGIHAGPIVAGIVGVKKFQYDVWGDTVNTASRMESNGEVGKVNISQDVYELIKEDKEFSFEYRGKIKAKGKGALEMYFVSKTQL